MTIDEKLVKAVKHVIRKKCTQMEHEALPDASGNSDPMWRAEEYARAVIPIIQKDRLIVTGKP